MTEEIQNEILLPTPQTELKGELKQKQWEKCMEGLARHRAIRKKQTEEEKLKKEQEKLALKQKIREEMMKEKLKEEVEKELQKELSTTTVKVEKKEVVKPVASTPEKVDKPSPAVQLKIDDLEEYLQWKKQKKRKVKPVVESSEESEDEEEQDYIPGKEKEIDSEEDEEKQAFQRHKKSRMLPPKAKLERTVSHYSRPAPVAPTNQIYGSTPPGRYFYL